MPKRRNPFGDGSPLQFKTHVRTKELNAGIGGEQNMRSIYERTKDMLFSGAKKNLYENTVMMDANENHPMVPNNNNNIILPPGVSYVHEEGQMVLNHQGQLSTPAGGCGDEQMDAAASTSTCTDATGDNTYKWDFFKKKAIPQAQIPLSPTKQSCSFCEKVFLRGNMMQCYNCHGFFCQLCSTTKLSNAIDTIYMYTKCPCGDERSSKLNFGQQRWKMPPFADIMIQSQTVLKLLEPWHTF
ncbi:hypothetical protein FSP39_014793 [Pinctada imbricata]|uniref:Uncharacterized protein n=1 Tax=Pinctada imbricata TaxID=66713 RepID=A0AA88Y087_PINIB|nr:hypothetical protein FSP39_014793 [Pinctada imbricata]